MTSPAHTTRKVCAGEYVRHDGFREVRVFYHDLCKGWMAAAEWDRSLYTDIVQTKRDAVFNADIMISEA